MDHFTQAHGLIVESIESSEPFRPGRARWPSGRKSSLETTGRLGVVIYALIVACIGEYGENNVALRGCPVNKRYDICPPTNSSKIFAVDQRPGCMRSHWSV